MDIIRTNNLEAINVIKYPNINIEKSKLTFICGESGCGKTTLLKLFNATLSPTKGEIYYNDTPIDTLDSVALRKEVLLASQTVFLFDTSIEENFVLFHTYREQTPPTTEKIKEYLKICCADFDLKTTCETMSGGERHRVFLAICLSFMPKALMMDEPTSALDESTAKKFFRNIKAFCAKNDITAICITHDMAIANEFADFKIFLEGQVR